MRRNQNGQLSEQAQVAKLIRQFCKSLGVKCHARSSSFSMGDSVDWTVYDQPPEVVKKIESYAAQFQYGHFNGMEDIYEYSNTNDDIPQSKFVHGGTEYSDELKEDAWQYLRNRYPSNAADLPEKYEDASRLKFSESAVYPIDVDVRGILNGSGFGLDKENSIEFWSQRKVIPITTPQRKPGSVTIEEHTHTKRGFQMFIVILAERVDRPRFVELRENAYTLGGWYSRKWGQTPCGFAFKELATAEQFISENFTDNPPDKPSGESKSANEPAKPRADKSEKLRTIADKMQPTIDNKLGDRLDNTPKRMREAGHARAEGARLKRTQAALRALANLHEAGTVPPILANITSKKAIYELLNCKHDQTGHGYYDYSIDTGTPPDDASQEALALWALVDGKTEEEKQAEALQQKITGLQFANIPGYFPTPDAVIELMLDYANIQPAHNVLEPSAGSGAICDAAKPFCASVEAVEINFTLAEILEAKGYPTQRGNFLEIAVDSEWLKHNKGYDRVVMNPPFENQADIDHVLKAYSLLNSGGRLVSVMSPAPFQRDNKKSVDFRTFVDRKGGEVVELPEGSFKKCGTGVNSCLLILDK